MQVPPQPDVSQVQPSWALQSLSVARSPQSVQVPSQTRSADQVQPPWAPQEFSSVKAEQDQQLPLHASFQVQSFRLQQSRFVATLQSGVPSQ